MKLLQSGDRDEKLSHRKLIFTAKSAWSKYCVLEIHRHQLVSSVKLDLKRFMFRRVCRTVLRERFSGQCRGNSKLHWFRHALPYDCSRKLGQSPQPIRYTNLVLLPPLNSRFPPLRQFACEYHKSSLVSRFRTLQKINSTIHPQT